MLDRGSRGDRPARLNAPPAQVARATRRYRPAFEGLEVRDLPSTLTVVDHAVTAQHERGPNLNLVVASETKKTTSAPAARVARTNTARDRPPWVSESLPRSRVGQLAMEHRASLIRRTIRESGGLVHRGHG
jgi:hypothetical protein